MKIDKLYEEMGREFARWQALTRLDKQEADEYQTRRKLINEKLDDSKQRLEVINEAIQMAQTGVDPLVAKMTAKDCLEERLKETSNALIPKSISGLLSTRRFPLPELAKTKDPDGGGEAEAGC